MLIKYANRDGISDIDFCDIGPDYIIVQFKDGSKYLFDYNKPGRNIVEKMKSLAFEGRGLNRYIRANCFHDYQKKLK